MELPIILSKYGLFVIAYVGMIAHFLKKNIKGESFEDIKVYFKTHFRTVILAVIATWIGWMAYIATLATGQFADVLTVFGIGYMCDSVFNKYTGKK